MHPLRSVRSKTLALSLAACLLVACIPAVAQQAPPTDRTATVVVKDVPLSSALSKLFASAGTSYTVTPAAQELMRSMKVTANLETMRLGAALNALLRTVTTSVPSGKRLIASAGADGYVIDVGDAPAPAVEPGPPPSKRDDRDMRPVTLHVHDAPLADVVRKIADQAGVTYRVHPVLKLPFQRATVSLAVTDVPARDALRTALAGAKGLPRTSSYLDAGQFLIMPVFQMPSGLDLSTKHATIHVRASNAARALKSLLDSAGVDYAFCDEQLGGARVTLDLKDEPLDSALKALAAQVPGDPKPYFSGRGGLVMMETPVRLREMQPANVPITFRLRNADARFALKALFSSVGANYTLDQRVEGPTTAEGITVPFPIALHDLLSGTLAIAPVEFRLNGNVFWLSVRLADK